MKLDVKVVYEKEEISNRFSLSPLEVKEIKDKIDKHNYPVEIVVSKSDINECISEAALNYPVRIPRKLRSEFELEEVAKHEKYRKSRRAKREERHNSYMKYLSMWKEAFNEEDPKKKEELHKKAKEYYDNTVVPEDTISSGLL